MAEVFLAVAVGPENFQRRLVIKRMLPNLSQDPAFVRMFVDEAKLCGLLSHPNLVQIFEFGAIEANFFIAMEHVQGETLLAVQRTLAAAGRLAPVAASLEIARQVCLGLHYAHALQSTTGQPLGIVHRDISPSNLMLSFHGGLKILDFGIARVAEGLRETHTQAGTMKGKVSYMSPEQIRMEHVDHRSDIFAVGVVLHELLTGRRLFRGSNEYNGARMVLESVVPLPSTVNREVPEEIDRVVMRALERNVEARYLTAAEMAEDLEKALFEMRASPHEPRRLVVSLFPHGPSRSGEVKLPATPLPVSMSVSMSTVMDAGIGDRASARLLVPRRRAGRRKWGALLALGGIVVAAILLVRPPWALAPHESTGTTAAIPAVAPPAPEPPPAEPAPPPVPAGKPVVEISLDSSPQDAQVFREDSGEVVGRTPLTIKLPQAQDVIAFRFEKPGYASTVYKVIPDLDKPVRAELPAAPAAPAAPVPASKRVHSAHRSAAARAQGAGTTTARSARPAAPDDAPLAAPEPARSCFVSVASFPWSELWIDGRDTGQRTPVVHYPVSCGAHKLGLKRRDLKLDRVERVTVAPDHELKQHYELSDEYGD